MYRSILLLALDVGAVLCGCKGPAHPEPPFPMQDGVRDFQMTRTAKDSYQTRICYTFLDGSAGCATYNNDPYLWDTLLYPVPVDSGAEGPVTHLALDEHGYCYVNAERGITCEDGRPLDDPAAWQALRGVVGLAAARSRICAWAEDHEILCSTGTPPETQGAALVRLRGNVDDGGVCAVTEAGGVICDGSDASMEPWMDEWLQTLDGLLVQDVAPAYCALLVDGTALCSYQPKIEGRYDALWETRARPVYFVNPKQAVYVHLLPDEPVYDLGFWEQVGMGIINNSRGTPSRIDGAGLDCALVEHTVYCM